MNIRDLTPYEIYAREATLYDFGRVACTISTANIPYIPGDDVVLGLRKGEIIQVINLNVNADSSELDILVPEENNSII